MACASSAVRTGLPPLAGIAIGDPGVWNPLRMLVTSAASDLRRRVARSGTPGMAPLPVGPWQATQVDSYNALPSAAIPAARRLRAVSPQATVRARSRRAGAADSRRGNVVMADLLLIP